jgi:hypothetical protein
MNRIHIGRSRKKYSNAQIEKICISLKAALLNRDLILLIANDFMCRRLPPDHPLFTSHGEWELPGLFPDRDRNFDYSEPAQASEKLLAVEEWERLSEEERFSTPPPDFKAAVYRMLRYLEWKRFLGLGMLASTRFYLSQSRHARKDEFLDALDQVANDFAAIIRANNKYIRDPKFWKHGRDAEVEKQLKSDLESYFSKFSATLADCFPREPSTNDDPAALGTETGVNSTVPKGLLQVAWGFLEPLRQLRDILILLIEGAENA